MYTHIYIYNVFVQDPLFNTSDASEIDRSKYRTELQQRGSSFVYVECTEYV